MISKKMRKCQKCDEVKSESFYHKNRSRKDGLHLWCRECRIKAQTEYAGKNKAKRLEWMKGYREKNKDKIATQIKANNIRVKYGITLGTYVSLLRLQESRCLICEREISDLVAIEHKNKAHLDHCHETGKIRGFLCSSCNKGIGHFNDDPHLVEKAARYLKKERNP